MLFLVGICCLNLFSTIPSIYVCFSLIIPLFIGLLFPRPYRNIAKYLLPIILGFCWVLCESYWVTSLKLPQTNSSDLTIIGTVSSIPEQHQSAMVFNFSATQINQTHFYSFHPLIMRLTWYGYQPEHVRVGDKWRLQVRITQPHWSMNAGNFNYQQWLFENKINCIGVIQNKGINLLLRINRWRHPVDRFRQLLSEQLQIILSGLPVAGMINALCVGMRDHITQPQWQVLRNTGTNHLMAIAGLHISCIVSMVILLANLLCRRLNRLFLLMPLQQISALLSLIAALIYSALAGFSLPTQRAIIMLSAFIITHLLRRNISAWSAWCLALLVILIIHPLSFLSSSFWLSFGTVALIIYGNSARLYMKGIWWHWGRMQWIIGLGIMPFSILFFQQVSLLSFIANTIAIPCVGFVILPLCFVGSFLLMVLPSIGKYVILIAEKLLEYLWIILEKLSAISYLQWHVNFSYYYQFLFFLIAVVLLLAPKGWPGRWLSVLWALPVIINDLHIK